MDMMELRRRLMQMAVANGAEYETGTFTTDNSTPYRITFNKSYSKYLYFIEMSDESKEDLMDSGQTSAKMYACHGIYPTPETDSQTPGEGTMLSYRIVPSTSVASTSASSVSSITDNYINITNNTISNGANVLYRGYTYKYFVVSLENME